MALLGANLHPAIRHVLRPKPQHSQFVVLGRLMGQQIVVKVGVDTGEFVSHPYSIGWKPDALTTSAQRCVSDAIRRENSAGEACTGSRHSFTIPSLTDSAASASRTDLYSRSTVSTGVPAGTIRPNRSRLSSVG